MRSSALVLSIVSLACHAGTPPGPEPVRVGVELTPVLVALDLAPGASVLAPGASRQLGAVARYADGSSGDATSSVSWSSSDPAVLAVEGGGQARALADGRATVSATMAAVTGRAEVVVAHGRLAFVTSVAGSGDLGTWPEAGGATGARAGDAACQARARAAGLPGEFRAWLSDSRDDAYCRLAGAGGKLGDRCGAAELPAAGGPWSRCDGRPFAQAALLPLGVIASPVAFDESCAPVPSASYFTGSNRGALAAGGAEQCADWTAALPAAVAAGSADATAQRWEGGQQASCDGFRHLLCLEAGRGAPWPEERARGSRVFVTSARGPGGLAAWPQAGGASGVAAGDAICNELARAAALRGNFKAWLAVPGADAADRLASAGPWVTVDGLVVALTRSRLSGGVLLTPITATETGGRIDTVVWTGVGPDGRAGAESCGGWTRTDAGAIGQGGLSAFATPWSSSIVAPCDNAFSLYCFED